MLVSQIGRINIIKNFEFAKIIQSLTQEKNKGNNNKQKRNQRRKEK